MVYLSRLCTTFSLTWCVTMPMMLVMTIFALPAYGEIRGDFNGDGYSDLAIGVPYEDIVVGTSTINDAGAVNVLYGTSTGLQASSPDDQFWYQGNAGVLDTAEVNDRFGWSLSTGDFNNDGYDDLAIGVPHEDNTTQVNGKGAVHVLYGSSTVGLQASSPNDQFWQQGNAGVMDTAELEDRFGWSLSVGNFNGDEYDDLAIGVPYENAVEGAVNVLYGSSAGLQATGADGRPDDQFWQQGSSGVRDSKETNDDFGRYLSVGDFNNDGYDDLAIAAPDEDIVVGVRNEGAVNVLYGSSTVGLQATAPDDQIMSQNSSGVLDTSEADDNFGMALPETHEDGGIPQQ